MSPGKPCPKVPGMGETVMCGRAGGPNFAVMNSMDEAISEASVCRRSSGSCGTGAAIDTVESARRGFPGAGFKTSTSEAFGCSARSRPRLAQISITTLERSTRTCSKLPRLKAANRMGEAVRRRVTRQSPSLASSTMSPAATRSRSRG